MAVVGVPHGVAAIIAAQTLIILPFSVMVIASVLVRLDRRLEEAATDLGASPWQVFTRVQLPLMRNGLVASFFIAFVLVVVGVRGDVLCRRPHAAAGNPGRVGLPLQTVARNSMRWRR